MEENITFQNSKGDNLSGVISIVNQDLSSSIILISHGFRGSKNGASKRFAAAFDAKGINSFRYDFYGHGESRDDFENITLSEGIDDLQCAVNYLVARGHKKIGLVGNSFGGACSIIAASRNPDVVYLLALWSTVSDSYIREIYTRTKEEIEDWKVNGKYYGREGEEKVKLNYGNFLEDMKNINGYAEASTIKVPTFIVHGDQDTSVPIVLTKMLTKVIPGSILKVIEGADHEYTDPNLKLKAMNLIIDFIANHETTKFKVIPDKDEPNK